MMYNDFFFIFYFIFSAGVVSVSIAVVSLSVAVSLLPLFLSVLRVCLAVAVVSLPENGRYMEQQDFVTK